MVFPIKNPAVVAKNATLDDSKIDNKKLLPIAVSVLKTYAQVAKLKPSGMSNGYRQFVANDANKR